jgi:hypothetical protein
MLHNFNKIILLIKKSKRILTNKMEPKKVIQIGQNT